ncbi:MAG: hypothetical protein ABIS06_04260 [Vicinamibacterales bacterium]
MSSDERIKQLEDQVAQLLAGQREDETRMLRMKQMVMDLEQEIKKLKLYVGGQRHRGQLGDAG